MTITNPDPNVILAQLAIIEAEISGVKKAWAEPPNSVTPADLPAFMNLAGPMNEDWLRSGGDELAAEGYETRQYYAVLVVASVGSGIPGETYRLITPFFAKCRNKFQSYPGMKSANAFQMQFQGDSGVITNIQIAGNDYAGIRFTLAVSGRVRVPYAAGQ